VNRGDVRRRVTTVMINVGEMKKVYLNWASEPAAMVNKEEKKKVYLTWTSWWGPGGSHHNQGRGDEEGLPELSQLASSNEDQREAPQPGLLQAVAW